MIKRIIIPILLALSINAVALNHNAQASFPTTSVLDNFNRANSTSSLGANYNYPLSFGGPMGIISNTAYEASSAAAIGIWNVSSFTGTQEAYTILSTTSGSSTQFNGVCLMNADTSGAFVKGYCIVASTTTIDLYYEYTGSSQSLLTSWSQTVSNGNGVGFSITPAGLITGYYYNGSTWTSLGTWTDTQTTVAYPAVCILNGDTTVRLSELGGGTQVLPPSSITSISQGKWNNLRAN